MICFLHSMIHGRSTAAAAAAAASTAQIAFSILPPVERDRRNELLLVLRLSPPPLPCAAASVACEDSITQNMDFVRINGKQAAARAHTIVSMNAQDDNPVAQSMAQSLAQS